VTYTLRTTQSATAVNHQPTTPTHAPTFPTNTNYQCQPDDITSKMSRQLHKGAALNNKSSDTEQLGYQRLVVEYKAYTYMHTYIILRIKH